MPPPSFDWNKLLNVAEALAQSTEESYLRTAAGRAYYYVCHLAKKRLENNDFYFSEAGDSHKQVWEKFDNSPDVRCKRLGEMGNFLRERRITADYKANYPRIQEDVPLLIERAKEFAKKLGELDPTLPRNTGVQR